MDVHQITLDPDQAWMLYEEYKQHRHYDAPLDREIMRAYKAIAAGKMVIKALEAIKAAGLNAQGFPKLAICPAHVSGVYASMYGNGSGSFVPIERTNARDAASRFEFPAGTFTANVQWAHGNALRPTIPLRYRPTKGIENYHVLWEAEWEPVPTRDPYLLRRLGAGDMWLVVAAWDLTEVERAALQSRMSA